MDNTPAPAFDGVLPGEGIFATAPFLVQFGFGSSESVLFPARRSACGHTFRIRRAGGWCRDGALSDCGWSVTAWAQGVRRGAGGDQAGLSAVQRPEVAAKGSSQN